MHIHEQVQCIPPFLDQTITDFKADLGIIRSHVLFSWRGGGVQLKLLLLGLEWRTCAAWVFLHVSLAASDSGDPAEAQQSAARQSREGAHHVGMWQDAKGGRDVQIPHERASKGAFQAFPDSKSSWRLKRDLLLYWSPACL